MGCRALLQGRESHLNVNGTSQVALVVKNLSANARDERDVGSIPGSLAWDSPGKNTGLGSHSLLQGSHSLLPDPGIEPRSPALQTDSLPSEPSGKSIVTK